MIPSRISGERVAVGLLLAARRSEEGEGSGDLREVGSVDRLRGEGLEECRRGEGIRGLLRRLQGLGGVRRREGGGRRR